MFPAPPVQNCQRCTTRSECGYGSGFRKTACTTLNTAVFAPIARARVRMMIALKPGLFRISQSAKRTSSEKWEIIPAFDGRKKVRLRRAFAAAELERILDLIAPIAVHLRSEIGRLH